MSLSLPAPSHTGRPATPAATSCQILAKISETKIMSIVWTVSSTLTKNTAKQWGSLQKMHVYLIPLFNLNGYLAQAFYSHVKK